MPTTAMRRMPSAIAAAVRPSRAPSAATAVARPVAVHPDLAAEQLLRPEPPEHEVGVGHGRLRAALAVAGRAGHGAGAARAHGQHARGIHRRDRPSAGADRVDVDLPQLHRIGPDAPVLRHAEAAVPDHGDVGAGATHVAGDDVRIAAGLAQEARRDDAGGRAGQHRQHRHRLDPLGGQGAASGGHDRQVDACADLSQAPAQAAEVAAHPRRHGDVQRSGAEALVLAVFRQHLGAGGDHRIGQQGAQQSGGGLLMRGVGVAVQEADGDGGDALGAQAVGDRLHLRLVQRAEDVAAGQHALPHAEDAVARDDGRRRRRLDVVHHGAVAAADDQHVAVPLRHQRGESRARPLQRRVGGDGRAVSEARRAPRDRCRARGCRSACRWTGPRAWRASSPWSAAPSPRRRGSGR